MNRRSELGGRIRRWLLSGMLRTENGVWCFPVVLRRLRRGIRNPQSRDSGANGHWPAHLDTDDYARLNARQSWVEQDDFAVERYRQFLRHMPSECARILDVGCGTGMGGEVLRRAHPLADLVGLDCMSSRIALLPTSVYSSAVVANATDLPYADRSFDVIVAGEFIEHLTPPDALAALREFARVLDVGGRLLMTTPNPSSLKLRLSGGSILNAHHLSMHSPRSLRRDLLSYGFIHVDVRGSGRLTRRLGEALPLPCAYGSYLIRGIRA